MTAKYVKLAPVLQDRQIADIDGGSLWSISGVEVKEAPADGTPAATFVRDMTRQGRIVEASSDEYKAYTAMCEDTIEFVQKMRDSKVTGHQETELISFANEGAEQYIGLLNGDAPRGGDPDAPTFQGKSRQDLLDLKKDELVAMADEEGVDSSGTKEEIADRLLAPI